MENAPTAHRPVGWVWVRPEDHGTGVEGLYAVGEAPAACTGRKWIGWRPPTGPRTSACCSAPSATRWPRCALMVGW